MTEEKMIQIYDPGCARTPEQRIAIMLEQLIVNMIEDGLPVERFPHLAELETLCGETRKSYFEIKEAGLQ